MEKVESFEDMVDRVAGYALTELIKGTNWRTIIWSVCQKASQHGFENAKGSR